MAWLRRSRFGEKSESKAIERIPKLLKWVDNLDPQRQTLPACHQPWLEKDPEGGGGTQKSACVGQPTLDSLLDVDALRCDPQLPSRVFGIDTADGFAWALLLLAPAGKGA